MKSKFFVKTILFFLMLLSYSISYTQDTFSIVTVDPETGEVGSAGASCFRFLS